MAQADPTTELAAAPAPLAGGPQLDSAAHPALRMAADGRIVFANASFRNWIGWKQGLAGHVVQTLQPHMPPGLYQALIDSGGPAEVDRILKDRKGHTVRLVLRRTPAFTDLRLLPVEAPEEGRRPGARKVEHAPPPAPLAAAGEQPAYAERRHMTIMFTDLRGFTAWSDRIPPDTVQKTLNDFSHVISQVVDVNRGSVEKVVGDAVISLWGAPPNNFNDHALRSIKAACDQMRALRQLESRYRDLGMYLPPCGIAINTGEMVVGPVGPENRQHYSAVGTTVNLAASLNAAARAGEILLTVPTMQDAIAAKPSDWEAVEAETGYETDLSGVLKLSEQARELPPEYKGKCLLLGPNVFNQPQNAVYCFYYLYLFQPKGDVKPFPVLTVVENTEFTRDLVLKEGAVVHSQGQKIFGRYRLMDPIGRGGMGDVWKASDQFGNVVAIKMLRSGGEASDSQIKRFRREAEIMSRLHHRNCCRIYEVGEIHEQVFIAMEYVDGASLGEVLSHEPSYAMAGQGAKILQTDVEAVIRGIQKEKESGAQGIEGMRVADELVMRKDHAYLILPLQQTLAIMAKVCDAVQAAHERGILHRDLKPTNILLRKDGDPVVMDFGLAKMETDQAEVSLSVSGQIVGTIEYMAPEQAESSKGVDERADVYALGAVLYQMITGRKHFHATGNIIADAQRLQVHEPLRPRQLNLAIDTDLELIVLKALEPEPAGRYRSAAALKDDLERYRKGEPISAKAGGVRDAVMKWVRRHHSLALALGISGGIITVGFAAAFGVLLHQRNQALGAQKMAQEKQRETELANQQLEMERNRAKNAERDASARANELADALRKIQEQTGVLAETQTMLARQAAANAREAFKRGDLEGADKQLELALAADKNLPEEWWLKAQLGLVRLELDASLEALAKTRSLAKEENLLKQAAQLEEIVRKYRPLAAKNASKRLQGEQVNELARDLRIAGREEYPLFVRLQQETRQEMLGLLQAALAKENDNPKPYGNDQVGLAVLPEGVRLEIKNDRKLDDLNALKAYPLFNRLLLNNLGVRDLRPLEGMRLSGVALVNVPVTALDPLRDMPLRDLLLENVEAASIEPVARAPLQRLELVHCKITDLKPLQQAKLQALRIEGMDLPSFPPFNWKELAFLSLSGTNFEDWKLLEGADPAQLNLSKTRLANLSGLRNAKQLRHLNIAGTQVASLEELSGKHLESLDMSDIRAAQLDALAGMPLGKLNVAGVRLISLEPLRGLPLKEFAFSPELCLGGFEAVASIPTLELLRVREDVPGSEPKYREYRGADKIKAYLQGY